MQQDTYVGSYTVLVNFVEQCRDHGLIDDEDRQILVGAVKKLNSGNRICVNIHQSLFRDEHLAHKLKGLGVELVEEEKEDKPGSKETKCAGRPCPCGVTNFTPSKLECQACGETEAAPGNGQASSPSEIPLPDEGNQQAVALRRMDMDLLARGFDVKDDVRLLMTCFRQPFDVLTRHHIQGGCLAQWIETIGNKYLNNPYHNWRHAMDVIQFFHMMITTGRAGMYFQYRDIFALYLAALAHDVAHPGVTSPFLISTSSELALKYNDNSVLENMHAHVCFLTMRQQGHNVLEPLSAEGFAHVRMRVIDAILATDNTEHYRLVEKLQEVSTALPEELGASADNRRLLAKAFTHMADLGQNCRHWAYHKHILAGLEEENFLMGDKQRNLGLPISPMCNRKKDSLASLQKGWCEGMVQPCLDPFRRVLTEDLFRVAKDNLMENEKKWLALVEAHGKLTAPELLRLDQ